MNRYYVDLHIHIGRTLTGKPVKITGAKSLTFSNIIEHARHEKGLNMIGIIDSQSPEVILEMESLMDRGLIDEHPDGGLVFGDLTVIPGSEIEIYDDQCNGPIHVLCYFPTLTIMKEFSNWLSANMKNVQLSSQRVYVTGLELQKKVKTLGGIFIPAHVFTPFKSLYGKGVKKSLTEVFDPALIDGIELGLSSDTKMADQLGELHAYTFVTNSDAHSLQKIAREYQVMAMKEPSFKELQKALKQEDGRKVIANYGLDPQLGKYHKTVCAECLNQVNEEEEICNQCGQSKIIKGVADRIHELKTADGSPPGRPPYIHQVPLEFIPGLGPRMLEKLIDHFGSEMAVLHEVPYEALQEVVPQKIVDLILKAREGNLHLEAGGGGKYGKIALQL
ncbi:endonuclease Q family protein [Neobacillus thermocopriae]|uniref:TIGR00375 family protein n=1 Tax=Neobacillus thermocopriae TaxID=1215031 RepID=A0A6B3TP89_9BACI|nr:endonuclease Q family protein [Neobacillus thermocopriae]NEX78794.1 TIGR00375 family protein [Neobacillus thermocopriae]